jgi:hypothetical protein
MTRCPATRSGRMARSAALPAHEVGHRIARVRAVRDELDARLIVADIVAVVAEPGVVSDAGSALRAVAVALLHKCPMRIGAQHPVQWINGFVLVAPPVAVKIVRAAGLNREVLGRRRERVLLSSWRLGRSGRRRRMRSTVSPAELFDDRQWSCGRRRFGQQVEKSASACRAGRQPRKEVQQVRPQQRVGFLVRGIARIGSCGCWRLRLVRNQ